jgi:hypothetical protein
VGQGFETAILEPHGGNLQGFILLRGSEEKLAQLRVDDEFVRLSTRASLVVEGVGVIGAALGDGLQDAIGTYQQAISDLTLATVGPPRLRSDFGSPLSDPDRSGEGPAEAGLPCVHAFRVRSPWPPRPEPDIS